MADYEYQLDRWKNRDSNYPTRRKLVTVEDIVIDDNTTLDAGTQIIANVERFDGNVSVVGTPFNATTMNNFETRINDAFGRCLGFLNCGAIDNDAITSTNGFDFSSEVSNAIVQCPILEFYYSDSHNNDGSTSERIFIDDYSSTNKISLDQISCGNDSDNSFYFKTITIEITNNNGIINLKTDKTRSKRLVRDGNGNFTVNTYDGYIPLTPDPIDIYINKIIGYKFKTT